MTTVIAGSRTITDPAIVEAAVKASGFEITEVLSGGAYGVDTLGEAWARANGIPVRVYPADWETFGKRAGMIRNETMASIAEAVLAIWDGKSPGTKHMISMAEEYGIPAYVYTARPGPLPKLRRKAGAACPKD